MRPLEGFNVVNLAVNVPGPVAGARLRELGAKVTKVEPPTGDVLAHTCPAWYDALTAGMTLLQLDIKKPEERRRLDECLETADLFMTSYRPASLARLALDWKQIQARFPKLCDVALVGYPPPRENVAGHDLTYQAKLGLLLPPHLPRALLADLAGAERAVSEALRLLLARERGQGAGFSCVSLYEAGRSIAEGLRWGLTAPGSVLGGGLPNYGVYAAKQGYVAIAAIEPHFLDRFLGEMDRPPVTHEDYAAIFVARSAQEWEQWATERDIPIVALREPACCAG